VELGASVAPVRVEAYADAEPGPIAMTSGLAEYAHSLGCRADGLVGDAPLPIWVSGGWAMPQVKRREMSGMDRAWPSLAPTVRENLISAFRQRRRSMLP